MDHHVIAAVSLAGISLDVLGGLYLAYDLLGGQHGPLRLLSRMVTYSVVFGIGYGLGLGLFFGIVSGAATGVTIAIELQRAARRRDHYGLGWEILFSAIRGLAFGAGLYSRVGLQFALAFASQITAGQAIAYWRGMRPGMDYTTSRHPRLTGRQFRGSLIRTAGYIATALLCSAMVSHIEHPWRFAARVGLVTGAVTTVVTVVIPYIEYYADNLPARHLGAFGIWLVLAGFALQSIQYWVALLNP